MKQELTNKKYVFVGNRYYVYKKMVENNLNIIKIYAVSDSYLSKYLDSIGKSYVELNSKSQLIDDLKQTEFDIIVSNGCPYILPISNLKNYLNDKGIKGEFINVHTSLLPDCKGKHPINAALLYGRRHGVTCHRMDDGIDTGAILEQIEICITEDISLDLLYKLSFMAEGDVFEKALKNGFVENAIENKLDEYIYYSRKEEDLYIQDDDSADDILRKVRAFSAKGMYAKLKIDNKVINIKNAKIIKNDYVLSKYIKERNNYVYLAYGDNILTKIANEIIEFTIVDYIDLDSLVDMEITFFDI